MTKHFFFAIAGCIALAACGTEPTAVDATPIQIAGTWRMKSFDTKSVPATYAEFFDEPVNDRIVHHVEIRLDSAVKQLRADSTYVRHYYFTELQDGVVAVRYLWGDHGRFSIGGRPPAPITLTSEYIQNLSAAGHVSAAGAIELSEQIWLGEGDRHTVWAKQ